MRRPPVIFSFFLNDPATPEFSPLPLPAPLPLPGKDGPSNHNRLCVKGRYGFDYAHHPHRLTKPLIRKPGMTKSADFKVDPGNWTEVFRERSEEHTSELQSPCNLVCRLLLEKKKN